jgi:hypothetical protein
LLCASGIKLKAEICARSTKEFRAFSGALSGLSEVREEAALKENEVDEKLAATLSSSGDSLHLRSALNGYLAPS